ncbi:tRNA (cytosine(34)-C(5))-methyltransferase-like [Ruditapes philippinarum]|uniref:tRNA (cytosine(34)-C(5))-methyltransferase-like n=1 Tax=Ruditapes philippinarum TaxID=129788 RepID=UPI00295AFB8F|nr:tRNA (cytosine(34)-C(5))-methyltransferase-like [Ruditapes philippinarum]
MCAAPGYQTTQILEQVLNSPKKIPDGFVVANDIDFRINYRWSQGTNVFFTHEDAKKFPDLYTTEEVCFLQKILVHVLLFLNFKISGTLKTLFYITVYKHSNA